MRKSFQVEPIVQGYQGVIGFAYSASFVASYPVMSGDLTADFRVKAGDPTLLFRATSLGGTITRAVMVDGSVQITITVPISATSSFPLAGVAFDVAQTISGVTKILPGQWLWPVKPPVTVLP